jgi:hypothetical protein
MMCMVLKLVIGNKNYSSWSMRPWLALRANGIAFEEIFIPLYTGEADKKRILSFTHSGKVPALIEGDVTVWDSPRARAFDFIGNALRLHGVAQRMRHEPAPPSPRNRAVG